VTASITDFSHFTDLRRIAGQGGDAALREVAGQFEALFIQTLLKNMREASLGEGLLGNSEQHKLYEGMLDQQLSLEMASGKGIGIAEMLVRQLGGQKAEPAEGVGEAGRSLPAPVPTSPAVASLQSVTRALPAVDDSVSPLKFQGAAVDTTLTTEAPAFDSPESFVRELWPHVRQAARELGVEVRSILAQAALETGWGKHMPSSQDGRTSFNLFGIKADGRWSGDAVSKPTIEFDDGIPRRETARFRAYGSVAESVADYVNFLRDNPRYDAVGREGGSPRAFAESLARAGYATDPDYAAKIDRVAGSEPMTRALEAIERAHGPTVNAGSGGGP
jgi:flagellar protein FlgJ